MTEQFQLRWIILKQGGAWRDVECLFVKSRTQVFWQSYIRAVVAKVSATQQHCESLLHGRNRAS
jgi:hypothetical protein